MPRGSLLEKRVFVDFGSIPLELCERFNLQMSSAEKKKKKRSCRMANELLKLFSPNIMERFLILENIFICWSLYILKLKYAPALFAVVIFKNHLTHRISNYLYLWGPHFLGLPKYWL